MSRGIAADILTQLRNNELTTFFLVDFVDNSGNVYKYTTLDVPLYFDSTTSASGTYSPRGFSVDSINYSMSNVVNDAKISIDNIDSIMTSIFVGDILQNNYLNLYVGVLGSTTNTDGPTGNLVSRWAFETEDDAEDLVGGNDGTLYNSPTWTTGIVDSYCYNFNGVDQYINVSSPVGVSLTDNFSISFWASPSTSGLSTQRVLSHGSTSSEDGYEVCVGNGTISLITYTSASGVTSYCSQLDNDGGDHHIAITKDDTTVSFYIDNDYYVNEGDNPQGTISGSTTALRIGGYVSNTDYCFDGKIDDIRIYSRAITSGEVSELYLTGTDPRTYIGSIGDPILVFNGQIDSWDLTEEEISINVNSELARWSQNTQAIHSSSCRWKEFKGTECGYTGDETWCDRSYIRCDALNNTNNFGGFRWLPSIEDKDIWWGSERSND